MKFDRNCKKYLEWINNEKLDAEMKEILQAYNDEELTAAFGLELEFGTAGIRGILGAGCGRFNLYTIMKVTIAYCELLIKKYKNELNRGVVIGHDNRHNSAKFALLCSEILSSYNIKSYLFNENEITPTPVVSFATKKLNCIGGIVITASHNPKEYNGYKIYDEFGCQLMPDDTNIIFNEMNKIENIIDFEMKPNTELIETVPHSVIEAYIKVIKNIEFYKDKKEEKKDLKIIFSAVNGTGTKYTPVILRELGYTVIEVEEHAFEDETFKNVINPNPEFEQAWTIPLQYAQKYDADIVILNDPDADRFGIAVKHNNEFIRLNGNETGAIFIDWKLDNLQKRNEMPKNPALYSSFVTSDLGDRIAHETYGVTIVKTSTGFKWMGNEIAKEKDNGLNFVFAYEESFGYVIDSSTRDKDGIQASILASEMAWYYKTKNMTLIDYLNKLYDKYGYYYTDTVNLNFKPEEKNSKIEPIIHKARFEKMDSINGIKIIKIEDYKDGLYNMPGQDLIKFYLEDKSWFALRPSGTEPKLKIYFIGVDKSIEKAKQKVKDIFNELKEKWNI